jgi:hypothetical protein
MGVGWGVGWVSDGVGERRRASFAGLLFRASSRAAASLVCVCKIVSKQQGQGQGQGQGPGQGQGQGQGQGRLVFRSNDAGGGVMEGY